jgi:hypothetical protein
LHILKDAVRYTRIDYLQYLYLCEVDQGRGLPTGMLMHGGGGTHAPAQKKTGQGKTSFPKFIINFACMRDGIHITKARKGAAGLLAAVLTGCVMMAICAPLRAQKTYHAAFYDRWAGLSSQALMDKAGRFMAEGDKPDSALVCYTIVANRYYERKQGPDDINHSANAMNDAGYIYFFHYFDYQKAYAYFFAESERGGKI